jgi:hypothetical protein
MKFPVVLITVYIAAMLMLAGVARADNNSSPILDAAASYIAGHFVSVWCETDWPSWMQMTQQNQVSGAAGGFTNIGTPVIYMAPDICEELHALADNEDVGSFFAADAILTLAHESVHQRGIRDEAVTDCTALGLVKDLATTYFNIPRTVTQTYIGYAHKRYAGVRMKVSVQRTRITSNPLLSRLQADAERWHKAKPTQYQGGC